MSTEQEQEQQDLVYALATSPNFDQDGMCFAARLSGLYRSEDHGASWRPAYDALDLKEALATISVVLSPDFASDQSVFAGVNGGVLRSGDGGASWHIAGLGAPPPAVCALAVSPNFVHDGVILAGTMEDGIFRSGDRGRLWQAWNFGLLDLRVLCMVVSPTFADDETIYVGTESGLFRSTNGGRAWREVDFDIDLAPVLSLALAPGGALLVGTEACGLHRSNDGGRTWARLGRETIVDAVNTLIIAPQPAPQDILVLHEGALLGSRDGGQSWAPWKDDLPGDITAVTAPKGLAPGAPLLVGLADGTVKLV
ncbi:MAG: hypothetical protein JXB47_19520 [Anaerolineae bacterium]|nr:hypothetical protein [Anaerolineae bacterium]